MANAPRAFQRVMHGLLGHLSFLRTFLDDILQFSTTREEHVEHTKQVLTIIKKKNITGNVEKSNIFKEEVNYLGNILNKEGIRPDISRIEPIGK